MILGLLPQLGFNIQAGGRGYLQPERCAEMDTAHPIGAVTKAPLQKRGQKMIPQIASLPPSLPPCILSLVLLIGQIQLEPESKETR